MFEVGTAAKCCEFKRYLPRLDSMLRELREVSELLSCDMHWVFLLGKRVRTVAKTMVMEKNRSEGTSFAMFGVGNPNAANLSDLPTDFAAELKL